MDVNQSPDDWNFKRKHRHIRNLYVSAALFVAITYCTGIWALHTKHICTVRQINGTERILIETTIAPLHQLNTNRSFKRRCIRFIRLRCRMVRRFPPKECSYHLIIFVLFRFVHIIDMLIAIASLLVAHITRSTDSANTFSHIQVHTFDFIMQSVNFAHRCLNCKYFLYIVKTSTAICV